MDIGQMLKNVFGEYPSVKESFNYSGLSLEEYEHLINIVLIFISLKYTYIFRHILEVNQWLNHHLEVESDDVDSVSSKGCLGPSVKVLDIKDGVTTVTVSKNRLTVHSLSAFSTVKANCCVYKGRWMYEVEKYFDMHFSQIKKIIVNKGSA